MRPQLNGQFYSYLETPIGTLLLAGDGEALSILGFPEGKMRRRHESGWHRDDDVFTVARQQLSDGGAAPHMAAALRTSHRFPTVPNVP